MTRYLAVHFLFIIFFLDGCDFSVPPLYLCFATLFLFSCRNRLSFICFLVFLCSFFALSPFYNFLFLHSFLNTIFAFMHSITFLFIFSFSFLISGFPVCLSIIFVLSLSDFFNSFHNSFFFHFKVFQLVYQTSLIPLSVFSS